MTVSKGKLEADSALDNLTSLRTSPDREDCGHFGICIDRNGHWFHQGALISRIPMVRLFATALSRHDDGSYWLTTPVENGRIEVEDVPYVAIEMKQLGEGTNQKIDFRTNLDANVPLDMDHRLRIEVDPDTGEPSPYIHVDRGIEARLSRSVYYHLVEIGEISRDHYPPNLGVWSRGHFHLIGRLETPR